ncbi:MAG TPA: hypothetical protein VK137_04530, partial [Planctomycetaceae bacterium]|nr:hypothetical protein [Planctomycetaceae bacterium]
SAGVSLFPCLAVLVCTMGSLILLLIVTTKRIRAAVVEKARLAAAVELPEQTPPETPPPPAESDSAPDDDSLNDWRTQIETLAAERDSARQQLATLERQLVAAQSDVLRTREQATTKQERLKAARGTQQQAEAERQRLRSDVAAMRKELSAAEQRWTDATERQKKSSSKFAFVPFDSRTGTTRRPILIECTDQFIRFVPEDVKLTPAELNGFTTGFNPLLIASRELIHYWTAYDLAQADEGQTNTADAVEDSNLLRLGKQAKEPYVLLLVRPTGAISFHIAKSLLGQLKISHGYELLDDDMELELASPDSNAKQICQQAVAQTLAEREKVLQVLARNRDLLHQQLQLEPGSRTFVPVEPPGNSPSTGFAKRGSAKRPQGKYDDSRPATSGSAEANSAGTEI